MAAWGGWRQCGALIWVAGISPRLRGGAWWGGGAVVRGEVVVRVLARVGQQGEDEEGVGRRASPAGVSPKKAGRVGKEKGTAGALPPKPP